MHSVRSNKETSKVGWLHPSHGINEKPYFFLYGMEKKSYTFLWKFS
jgi:hypothetical protein